MTQFHNISVNIRFNFPCNSITVCEWNSVASRRAIMTTMDETCWRKVVSLKTLEWLSIGIFLNRSVNYLREMLASKWKFSFDRKLIHAIFNLLSFDLFLLLVLRILLRLTRAKKQKVASFMLFFIAAKFTFLRRSTFTDRIDSTPLQSVLVVYGKHSLVHSIREKWSFVMHTERFTIQIRWHPFRFWFCVLSSIAPPDLTCFTISCVSLIESQADGRSEYRTRSLILKLQA